MDNQIIIVRKDSSPEKIDEELKQIKPHKPFDPAKYLGKVKGIYNDAVAYQKAIRDEWS
jgi:hypothetical protein